MRWIVLALALSACGGPAAAPAEEVTATWTAGDDAPLPGHEAEDDDAED